jgi:membrane-associated protease RseP (regulator of RpoE activity)
MAATLGAIAALAGAGERAEARQVPGAQPGQYAAPVQVQAAPIPAFPGGPQGAIYSPRLGASYTLVPYGQGYAARIAAPPGFGSPLAQPQIQLEAGDTITALDGLPIRSTADVENHYDQTSVTFINVRSGQLETRWVTLGPQGAFPPGVPPGFPPGVPPGFPPGFPPAAPLVLGVTGNTVQMPGFAGGGWGLQLTSVVPGSAAQAAGLYPGELVSRINNQPVYDMNTLRAAVQNSGGVCQILSYGPTGGVRNVVAYLGGGGGGVGSMPAAATVAAPAAGAVPYGTAPGQPAPVVMPAVPATGLPVGTPVP